MKIGYWILIILGVLFFLFIIGYTIFKEPPTSSHLDRICGYWNKEACDKSCVSDKDCKYSCGGCLNVNENFSTCKEYDKINGNQCIEGIACTMIMFNCKCVDHQCAL